MGKKGIIITGANGFIGKHLVRHFEEAGYDVWPWTRRNVDLAGEGAELQLEMIAEDNNYFEEYPILIHAATYDAAPSTSDKDKKLVLETNLRMFMNILDIGHHFEKVFYFGSGAEKESDVTSSQYGLGKLCMNEMAKAYGNVINLRLYGVYGPGEDWRYRRLSNMCSKAALGLPVLMQKYFTIDYLPIVDLCRIMEEFVKNPPDVSDVDVCRGAFPMRFFVQTLEDVLGQDLQKVETEEDRVYGGDWAVLRWHLPNDFKFTSHETALKQLYDYYVENEDMIKREEYAY